MVELYPEVIQLIKSKFNVLYETNVRDIDVNLDKFLQDLDRIQKKEFNLIDRILLVHMDTDYYDPLLPCGNFIINLIRIFKDKQIPFFTLLFITNHFGIHREFDKLLSDYDLSDRPTIVQSLLSPVLLSKDINTNIKIDLNNIQMQGICMMGTKRTHRIGVLNYFKKNNLLSKIAVNSNFK